MDRTAVADIYDAVEAARRFAHASGFTVCDVDDIDELIAATEHELGEPHPNAQRLTLSLNSIARSLRGDQAAHDVCLKIDAALRGAGFPSSWAG